VVADFSTIQIAPDGKDRVKITGVKGYEPTPLYKVSMAYQDGFKVLGTICISGPNARAKAEKFANIFWDKVGKNFAATETEFFGWNACHRSLGHQDDGNEIILRVGARDADQSKLRKFSKMVPALILSGPPGVCVLGGAPKPTEVVSYWPALMPKSAVKPRIAMYENGVRDEKIVDSDVIGNFSGLEPKSQRAESASCGISTALKPVVGATLTPLSKIALGRSGDKGIPMARHVANRTARQRLFSRNLSWSSRTLQPSKSLRIKLLIRCVPGRRRNYDPKNRCAGKNVCASTTQTTSSDS
jgi:hypothetical protein